MSGPFVSDAQSAIQFMMCIGCLLMGLSHIVQPGLWRGYFVGLREQGFAGVLTRTMLFELWPAVAIVALHQVWSGPGIVLTVYGWLLLGKCAVSLLAPQIGLRSIGLAGGSPRSFVVAGAMLMALGASCGLALVWK